jgi:hypothetical protein
MAQQLSSSNATIKAIRLGDARERLSDGAGLYLCVGEVVRTHVG